MTPASTPPAAARWLLEHALPPDVRESVTGDLDEVFQRDCRMYGLPSARRRYWRLTISFTWHFVVERWRDRRRGSLMRMGLSWLDFKVGVRMLSRYPMLTVVGSLAMAVAIGVGAGTFDVIMRVTNPSLPLPDGDRIVGLNYWHRAESGVRPPSAYDFLTWREGLRTLDDIGAYRLVQRNLTVGEHVGDPVDVAEISAAAFRATGVPPLMGRVLSDEDESPQSPAVVVLGQRLWRTRFDADPAAIGRVVRLGATPATVVGVMPEGFAFPVRHNLWTPLRLRELPQDQSQRTVVRVFARLAPGVELREAQAELTVVGSRAAARFPEQYEHLQPRVLPYAESFVELPPDFLARAGLHSINAFGALFLVVVCGNVALLMFARAATREREILVRRALGAARSRIVMQLFAEALVLAAVAAVLGLAATDFALKWTLDALSSDAEPWPFWIQGGLSATTVTYSAWLTLLAAVVAGVVPALKITRTNMEAGLRQASTGVGGIRMGGMWTGVIVAQIAGTVLFTAVAYVAQRQAASIASVRAAFPAEEFLAVRLEMDPDGSTEDGAGVVDEPFLRRYEAAARELEQRLAAEAIVAGATLANRLPLMSAGGGVIEFDAAEAGEPMTGREFTVGTSAVDPDFFDVFQAPVIAGQGFAPRDTEAGANTVVVNQLFVDQILAGRNAVGRRIRYRLGESSQGGKEPGPWFEIIGVVRNLVPDPGAPMGLDNPAKPLVYHALGSDRTQSGALHLAVHVRSGDPMAVLPALRRIAAEIGPALRLTGVQRLDQVTSYDARGWRGIATFILVVSAIALLLTLAGIYAITSFTVSRRTREIAVRVALGAQISSVAANVFRRPLLQVVIGVAAGCLMMGTLVVVTNRDSDVGAATMTSHAALLLAHGATMMGACALACIGPLLRVFRVQPTDVLRDEG
jgi:putative ABC transport system permease protein